LAIKEAQVIEWLRAHARQPFTQPTNEMRVTTERCGCGCVSLLFDAPTDRRGSVMLADEILRDRNGEWCGVILWGNSSGQATWLEVYDGFYKVADRPLDAANLCRWEDLAG
jgi:hypothetical protein